MATTTPTLGGTTLPEPAAENGYREIVTYRGGSIEMADGSVKFDLVQSSVKRRFVLAWRGLNGTQKGTVETAYATVKTATATLVAPTGTSYTVTRDPAQTEIEWETFISAGDLRYSTSIQLREV